jgi:hypothetical protein
MAEMCDQISKIYYNIDDKLGSCFWKLAGLDTFEINVQNSQIFEKIFHINSLSEQITEAEESDRNYKFRRNVCVGRNSQF